ncbi:VWA domain-containing protein [Streptomyces iakyrus]|uniref:VWA domain-containing protein n=1 Tax=Streptomyces iakyrus TaxID=68219 RepID=UPI000524D280|nr:VWA domain-containing protein [Streptomyces iakyrus]
MSSAGGPSAVPPSKETAGLARRRAGRARGAFVAASLLALLPFAAPTASADTAPSRAEIYDALGLDEQPADYVVLVDTSGSMANKGRYNTVRSTLRQFLDGLSAKDHIALFTFDSSTEPRYVGSGGDTDAIMSRLPASPDPDGETDVGSALNSALGELEREDAAEVASVVLLTDGEHSPPKGSRYPKSTGAAWTDLYERAQDIGKGTELAGYALPLGDGATGAELLGEVVDDTTVLRPDSIEDLGGYLKRAGDGARARKAGLLLAGDEGEGITASWSDGPRRDITGGSVTARLTLRSTARHVPLSVSGLDVSVPGDDLRISGLPSSVTLGPGESRTFPVRVRGTLPDGPLPFRRDRDTDARLSVAGRVSSDWERPLAADVRLDVPRRVQVTGAPLPLRATVGSAALLPALLTGMFAVLLACWLRWRRTNRPRLSGELLLTPVYGGQLPDRIQLNGRRVDLRPHAIGGRGSVRGRRRSTEQGPRVDLRIRYTPDGSAGRESDATCGPGGQVVVNGVSFTYLPERRADGVTSTGGRPR